MYDAIDVARYVIEYSNEKGNPISNLKLQKLLYYIQAASLVEQNEKCFKDEITAWEYGPVVASVYQEFCAYGRESIPDQEERSEVIFDFEKMDIVYRKVQALSDKIKEIVNKVIDAYSDITNPFVLVKKTHQESPWKDTSINSEISCDKIKTYYSKYPEKIYNIV